MPEKNALSVIQTSSDKSQPFRHIDSYIPLSSPTFELYRSLREAIPIVDAAIIKLSRLVCGFSLSCKNKTVQEILDNLLNYIPVGGNQFGIKAFISSYFEQLLMYGTAIGEVVSTFNGDFAGLYNADLDNIELRRNKDGFNVDIFLNNGSEIIPVKNKNLIVFSTLNPEAGKIEGTSLLHGLPFISSILIKIYNTLGVNWERIGNVRFAVTYKPQNDTYDKTFAKERAMQIASEWSSAMQSGKTVKDFVAVGDVNIKVIGADNQILDSEIPVKQMLEQIVAKTGLPPFMLGLSWSSTERMSSQQSDVLTSELEFYRKNLEPIILKIATLYLNMNGISENVEVLWDDITLQDAVELSKARLYNAQAEKLEKEQKGGNT